MREVTIYREAGRYGGWPANYGMWAWGNELVLGFTSGWTDPDGGFHARDRSRPFETMQARSTDGGLTWRCTLFPGETSGGRGLSADEHVVDDLHMGEEAKASLAPPPGDIDFFAPDFAMMCARTGLERGAFSFFYVSRDRCRSWQGPYLLPMFGQTAIAARTDYLALARDRCLLFLTANKRDGNEGKVICVETTDGGASFGLKAEIGEEPARFRIMPASVRLPDGSILVATRCRSPKGPDERNWIEIYRSRHEGAGWELLGEAAPQTGVGGNPPTMNLLADGRVVLTYGFRDPPFGMRARLSADGGESWSDEIELRTGAGNHDLGYPRTVMNAAGQLVTAYYYNDDADGDRYIAATVWEPPN